MRMLEPNKSLNHNAFLGPNPRLLSSQLSKTQLSFVLLYKPLLLPSLRNVVYGTVISQFAEFSTLLNHSPWNTLRLSELPEFTKHSSPPREYIMMIVVT